MSKIEQCPSTLKKSDAAGGASGGAAAATPESLRAASGATGRSFWRSLDDLAGTREFRDFLEREFPAHASELLDGSRRHFLKIMGASLTLAGAFALPGCRRPDHRLIAYNEAPEHSIPGKPLFYATALPLAGGGAAPVLAETYGNRPTKLEGNPLHPSSRGKSDARTQAAILDLYDPDRAPVYRDEAAARVVRVKSTRWEDFTASAGRVFGAFDATRGRRLAFLVGKRSSPTRDRLRDAVRSRWPEAVWAPYEPGAMDDVRMRGLGRALGTPAVEELDLTKADVVVTLDRDLLATEGTLTDQRGWSHNRYRPGPAGSEASRARMSRLYAVESRMTLTGGQADHRLPLRPTRVRAFAKLLTAAVLERIDRSRGLSPSQRLLLGTAPTGVALGDDVPAAWLETVADELVAAGANAVVTAGPTQDETVHALAAAINEALGARGTTVTYREADAELAADGTRAIADLTRRMRAGEVDTLVIVGGNPVYGAPGDLMFADAIEDVATVVHHGDSDETAALVSARPAAAGMHLPASHALEAWGDVTTADGTYSVVQPMIDALWDTHSDLELLAVIASAPGRGRAAGVSTDPYQLVRDTFARRMGMSKTLGRGTGTPDPKFETAWRRTLHDGLASSTVGSARRVGGGLRWDDVASMAGDSRAPMTAPMGEGEVEVLFRPCPKVGAGDRANNGWMQELPEGVTKIAWDNPAQVSLATARRLGLRTSRELRGKLYNYVDVMEVSVGDASVEVPVWIQPGLADGVVVLDLGYGREVSGRVGEGVGVDVNPVRRVSSGTRVSAGRARRAREAKPYMIATTQDHWSLEGRDILREVDLHHWREHGDVVIKGKDAYGNEKTMAGAVRLGMEAHTPVNRDVYKRDRDARGGTIYYHRVDEDGRAVLDEKGRKQRPVEYSETNGQRWAGKPIQQWGMSIDMTRCTGCNACVTACQAENNIPIVGKAEVAKGREMHWIRVDRYYSSERMDESAFAEPAMSLQPMTCVHCENAPCEVVCPVNATVHSPEGTNDMAYNRCIGTRYCSNNCPYKVRRFNYFDYATKAYNGDFAGSDLLPEAAKEGLNEHLVPPRLREKREVSKNLQYNPHVTVRSRGVMEKCTYCMQRINAARVETKIEDLDFIPDGFFQVACQQACPADAIVFGDIYDYESNGGAGSLVYQIKQDARTYAVLAYLNTHPRTTHALRVRNQNFGLLAALGRPLPADPFEHGGHGPEHGGEHPPGPSDGEPVRVPADEVSGTGPVIRLPVLGGVSMSGAMA